jgi:hypothetical protein
MDFTINCLRASKKIKVSTREKRVTNYKDKLTNIREKNHGKK